MRTAIAILVILCCWPAHGQQISRELLKNQLGQALFEDPRLSADGSTSCASCHDLAKGGSDGLPKARGMARKIEGPRNSPTVVNSTRQQLQFWDQRADSIFDQALAPLTNPIEMGNGSVGDVINRLRGIAGYRQLFAAVYSAGITRQTFQDAIVSYENTLVCSNAPIDRYLAGRTGAMSTAGLRGWITFKRVGCIACHIPSRDFRDELCHNTGVSHMRGGRDRGRADVAGVQDTRQNIRAFKTPTLRNIALTAPYMHDGSFPDLESVVTFYAGGGVHSSDGQRLVYDELIDRRVLAINGQMSLQDISDVVAFLRYELTCDDYPQYQPAKLPR